jgi:hypothetical protein
MNNKFYLVINLKIFSKNNLIGKIFLEIRISYQENHVVLRQRNSDSLKIG